MKSWRGNIVRLTGLFSSKSSTSHLWISHTKGRSCGALTISLLLIKACIWAWTTNRAVEVRFQAVSFYHWLVWLENISIKVSPSAYMPHAKWFLCGFRNISLDSVALIQYLGINMQVMPLFELTIYKKVRLFLDIHYWCANSDRCLYFPIFPDNNMLGAPFGTQLNYKKYILHGRKICKCDGILATVRKACINRPWRFTLPLYIHTSYI